MKVERYYRPELDILRFFAFLLVFLTHRMDLAPIDPVKYYVGYHISLVGVFGVPLFFFLSAFLITELLTKEKAVYGKISVRSFYIRRILRIWPLYFIFFFGMVTVTSFSDMFGAILDKPFKTDPFRPNERDPFRRLKLTPVRQGKLTPFANLK